MAFTQIVPLLAIVFFWMIIFVCVFWFFTRSQSAPRDDEPGASADELHAAERESARAEQESAKVEIDDQIPSAPGH